MGKIAALGKKMVKYPPKSKKSVRIFGKVNIFLYLCRLLAWNVFFMKNN